MLCISQPFASQPPWASGSSFQTEEVGLDALGALAAPSPSVTQPLWEGHAPHMVCAVVLPQMWPWKVHLQMNSNLAVQVTS